MTYHRNINTADHQGVITFLNGQTFEHLESLMKGIILRMTPLYKLVQISYLKTEKYFYRTGHLNEEVNCNESSPSVSVPRLDI